MILIGDLTPIFAAPKTRSMKNFALTGFLLTIGLFAFSQEAEPDWIELMKDGNHTVQELSQLHEAYWADKEITKGCGWKPFKRWESLMVGRQHADGTPLKGEDYMKVYGDVKTFNASRSPSGNWQALGPVLDDVTTRENIRGVGRTSSVAFHPTDENTIFVGCPAGGVWRSYDGGENWESNTDQLPSLGVSAIAFDPSNPEVVYIGTGDRDANDAPGMGVMKSVDAGLTWGFSNSGLEDLTIGEILIHPIETNILLCGTNDGIFRSTDSGASWQYSSPNTADYRDMKFNAGDPDVVYATGSGKFYKSTDAGENWNWINDGIQSTSRMVIGVTPANPDVVYVCAASTYEFQRFYRSSDAGETFEVMSDSPNILGWAADGSSSGGQAWYDFCMAADPLDSMTVYVGGIRMKRSIDGGVTWEDINSGYLHVDQHELEFSPFNKDLYLVNDGGFYHYVNNEDWLDISTGLVNGQIYKMGQSPHNGAKALTGFQDNGTSEYMGAQWVRRGGGDGFECWYDHTDEEWRYGSLYYGRIYRTSPDFINQQICGLDVLGVNEEGAWITPWSLSRHNENHMFVGLKNVWRCTNVKHPELDSLVWEKISNNIGGSNNVNLIAIEQCASNENIVYSTEGLGLIYRTDSAFIDSPTWIDASGDLPFVAQPVTCVETHPSADSVAYIGFDNRVWKSTNKGENWTDISGTLPDVRVNTIVYDINSDEGLYVGTDMGVYYKDVTMDDWISFAMGLPLTVQVRELEIYNGETLADSRLRAATYGRGLWESDLFGSETYYFPAAAYFPQGSYSEEEFDNFTVDIAFYKNLQQVTVIEFTTADIYVENAEIDNLEVNGDGLSYTLSLTIDQYGPIKIYIEDQAAIDDFDVLTGHSDTLVVMYNPPPAPFGHTGPGGLGDDETLAMWLRADKGSMTNGNNPIEGDVIDQWINQGNGPDALQSDAVARPTFLSETNGINGMAALHFDGEDDYLIAEGVLPGSNLSIFSLVEGDEINFNAHGWMASARQDNGFVLHPWENEPRFSTMMIDDEGNYANGTQQYIGDASAPHIYGMIYERTEYYQKFFTIFDENRWENNADIGPRDAGVAVDVKYGWDYDERFGQGKMSEHFIYNRRLYESHRTIVINYLSAKYGVDAGLVKRYFHSSRPYDVAGIGRESAFDIHEDAQGTGIVRISDASNMGDEDYLIWGHDGAAYEWEEDGYPILSQRLATTWGYTQTGDLGEVIFRIAASAITEPGDDFGLIVGSNDDFLPEDILDYYPLTFDGDYYTTTLEFPESGVFTLGVEPVVAVENLSQTEIAVFPNPSEDLFNVQINNTSLSEFKVFIFDALGRKVEEFKSSTSTFSIDSKDWTTGNYVLRIEGGEQVIIRKLVKF